MFAVNRNSIGAGLSLLEPFCLPSSISHSVLLISEGNVNWISDAASTTDASGSRGAQETAFFYH